MATNGSVHASLKERLLVAKYSRKACLAALQGEEIPHALGDPVHRLCVIRGIPEGWKLADDDERHGHELDYVDWPPGVSARGPEVRADQGDQDVADSEVRADGEVKEST